MDHLRVGVIGLGVGKRHLQSYAAMDGVRIVAVADLDGSKAEEQARAYGAQAFTDGRSAIEECRLDAVSICTPPKSHRELTEAAAAYGVHVLCEKPMAPTLEDCDAMTAACAHAGVRLMVAQKKRFHPLVQRLRDLTQGELGAIRWAVVKYALGRVPMAWFWDETDGGGPIQENSIHAVDLLRHLMGEVATVFATGGNLFNPDHAGQVDTAAVSLQFRSGAIAALGLGQATEWTVADEHFFFAGDGGEARFSGRFDVPVNWWMALRGRGGVEETVPPDDCFDREIGHFLSCVRTGAVPLVTGQDARNSVAVTVAIKESVRTGSPVKLDR